MDRRMRTIITCSAVAAVMGAMGATSASARYQYAKLDIPTTQAGVTCHVDVNAMSRQNGVAFGVSTYPVQAIPYGGTVFCAGLPPRGTPGANVNYLLNAAVFEASLPATPWYANCSGYSFGQDYCGAGGNALAPIGTPYEARVTAQFSLEAMAPVPAGCTTYRQTVTVCTLSVWDTVG